MNKKIKDWDNEVQYLNNTLLAIDKKIEHITKNVDAQKEIIEELKTQYYSEKSSHEMDRFDNAALFGRIDDMTSFTNEQIDQITDLMHRKSQPYFGRIDFVVSKEQPMPIYVGLRAIDDSKNYYVFDWRAPVGELFYEYGKGKASYETPHGVVKGEITLKRQYDISNGQLNGVYDVDQNIYDEYLQKLLSSISSSQLHNIASTIQREQNEIIRNIKDDIIVVQGCVGSGKTTVALHRIAYMLYKLNNLHSNNILLFSPNELFFSHISNVLPELGEQNTHTATFGRFVQKVLNIPNRIENMDEFVIRYENANKNAQKQILKKLNISSFESIKKFVEHYVDDLKFVKGFKLRGHTYTAGDLNKLLQQNQGVKLFDRLNLVHQTIMQECKLGVNFAKQLYEEIIGRLNNTTDNVQIFNLYLKSQGYDECDFREVIKYEDAILLCLYNDCVRELRFDMDIKHIVFDEVQEYPLVFLDFVMRMFPHAQYSMYGDDAQCTTPGAVSSIKDILNLTSGYRTTHYYKLEHTYRSSEEIVEYTNNILGLDMHNAFRLKYGQPVEEIVSKNYLSNIQDILQKTVANNRSIGIICGDIKICREIYQSLNHTLKHNTGLIVNAKDSSIKQIQILPVTMSKGLEYDTLIVVSSGGVFDGEFGKNQLYIACTRAINKLYVLKQQKEKK